MESRSREWVVLIVANTAGVIVLTAGTVTFANDWYQTKNVNWKVPVATVLLAAGIGALENVSPVAANGLAVMVLIGAATTKFGGKSFADTITGALTTSKAGSVRQSNAAPPAPPSRGGHSILWAEKS